MNSITVAEIMNVMERLAPPVLAEEWDNCGLQVGASLWPVNKVWVALDALPVVVNTAVNQNVDMLITHHPLMIRPIRTIDVTTPTGKIIETALNARMAIYSAHTNLDCAREGVNQALAREIGLQDLVPMIPFQGAIAGETSDPPAVGMGRLGRLAKETSLEDLVRHMKASLNIGTVKVVGNLAMKIRRVAVCSGSGSSILDHFLQTQAQVYVSGDLRYHDARRIEDAGRALIDIGHFSSEHLVVGPLVEQLNGAAKSNGWQVSIAACRLEEDPFLYY